MAASLPISSSPPLPLKPPPPGFKDPCSFSNPSEVLTHHIHLVLHIDLTQRLLAGTATYTFRVIDRKAENVVLDVRGITISSITDTLGSPLPYRMHEQRAPVGDGIIIQLPPLADDSDDVVVRITYGTDGLGAFPTGGACDWLTPDQAGGRPFVFTQCQSIHARSVLPCQDTPAAKAPYTAVVTLDEASRGLQVVMSALQVPSLPIDPPNSVRFECQHPIPSYLFAFAVGRLDFRDLSPRCRVWALPDVIGRAAWEFEEVELMLQTAEKIAGPYVWGRYDLLVLPPSFPYGGMENPMLTFVTPTLLSGDRSLVSVVAHEIAHSWTGNLVSCQSCAHFWINEGFTVKLERRILRELYGTGREGLDAVAGRQDLDNYVESVGLDHKTTSLVTKLEDGEDPDDSFSCVSYEKGYNFLLYLEQRIKQDRNANIDEFFQRYFERFQYQAISTTDFEELFKLTYNDIWKTVDFEKWLHGTGKCPQLADLDTSLVEEAENLADDWLKVLKSVENVKDDTAIGTVKERFSAHGELFKSWDPKQKLCLLNTLSARILSGAKGKRDDAPWNKRAAGLMQDIYNFNAMRNAEMRLSWCRLALAANYEPVLENVTNFLKSQGRMKFVRPLFKDLHTVFPKGNYARDLFAEVKPTYHSLAVKMVERDLADDGI